MFSKELDKAKGKACNLEVHNFHKNPGQLEKLNEAVQQKNISSFNNLSFVNSSGDQIEVKSIADIVVQNTNNIANLVQMVSGLVQICCLNSQNNESSQESLVKIRNAINQSVPLSIHQVEKQPLQEDLYEESKYDEEDVDNNQIQASIDTDGGKFKL